MGQSKSKNETAALVAEVARLKDQLNDSQAKANEHQNLLRYKVEVLVNMLAAEEKKCEMTESRLETLKVMVSSNGIDESSIQNISSSVGQSITNDHILNIDVDGALQRMAQQFSMYRVDIVQAFADNEGKVLTNISYDEFSKQLYSVTDDGISVNDIQVLAIRFGNGYGAVTIPEFLEYFATPPPVRVAKASTAAVRMSLDLLHLEMNMNDAPNDDEEEEGDNAKKALVSSDPHPTHRTDLLEGGARKLLRIWPLVREPLQKAFAESDSTIYLDREGKVIHLNAFKSILLDHCGGLAPVFASAEEPHDLPRLSQDDIDLLATRFELRDSVHVGLFAQYFDELLSIQETFSVNRSIGIGLPATTRSSTESLVSPFRVSSEWRRLKAQSVFAQTQMTTEKLVRKSLLPLHSYATAPSQPPPAESTPPAVAAVAEKKRREEKGSEGSKGKDSAVKEDSALSSDSKEAKNDAEDKAAVDEAETKKDKEAAKKAKDPPPKPSFADFFRCGKAKPPRDDHRAPEEAPERVDGAAAEPGEEKEREESATETPLAVDVTAGKGSEESKSAAAREGDALSIKRDDQFDTPPKASARAPAPRFAAAAAEAKTTPPPPSGFSRPKAHQAPRSAGADSDADLDSASQGSDPQRPAPFSQSQGHRKPQSRFRKVPQKGFDVEEFDGNDSFYGKRSESDRDMVPAQENVMTGRPLQRKLSGREEGKERTVNFSPSTRV